MPDVLHNIGNTPLVRVNKISKTAGLKCELGKRFSMVTVISGWQICVRPNINNNQIFT